MGNEMTELTQSLYDQAVYSLMTVQEAVDFLERESRLRTLAEKLNSFAKGRDLQEVLTAGLLEHHPEMKKDSVQRRVRGWLSPRGPRSIKKQDAIEVCFILGLSVEEADSLVAMISEEGLHWRNPDEVVYIFALRHQMDYSAARRLHAELKEYLEQAEDPREIPEDSFTPVIRSEISALQTEEALKDYLRTAGRRLGRCHNNAYSLFMEMMDILEHPREDNIYFDEKRLTIRDILKEYFYSSHVLYAKQLAKQARKESLPANERFMLTRIQEVVSENWPDETTLSKMKKRTEDVTRKTLILLFLATDPGLGWEDDDYEPDTEEMFQDLYSRLNDMLVLCGFSPLDPRSPFDWIILYSICVPDMAQTDIRLRTIFRKMFGEAEKKA